MRKLDLNEVSSIVSKLLQEAVCKIDGNILERISTAIKTEANPLGKSILEQIEANNRLSEEKKIPLCQDTGQVLVFLEVGSKVYWEGDIEAAINHGVREGSKKGYLRNSVVTHPLNRINTGDNTPAIIHTKISPGDKVKITIVPKGGGSENVSLVKMLTPADGEEGLKKLVLETILEAGGRPCPPIIVGIGIGGNLEKAAMLAKEALLRDIDDQASNPYDRKLEENLLQEINNLGLGPMGLGGTTTALAVKVNSYPCHIASFPVAINIQCHAARHKSIII
jgi:fumarate hydratase subunit alpha